MATPALAIIQPNSGSSLNLNDQSRYFLYQDFFPPAVQETPLIASGSSANRYGGGALAGVTAQDRDIAFTINLRGSSVADIRRAERDVAQMLRRAGDESQPVYLEFHPNPAAGGRYPSWGQGGWLRYEIIHGACWLNDQYLRGARLAEDVPLRLTLTLKPYAIGQPQQVLSGLGGLLEDRIGTTDGQSRGLLVPPAVTNKMTNPVFGHSTPLNGWSAGAQVATAIITDPALLPGPDFLAAVEIVRTGTPNTALTQSINVGNTNAHMLSCYARRRDGAPVTSSDVILYYAGNIATTFTAVGNGWYRLTGGLTGIASSQAVGVNLAGNGRSVIVTGFQLEERAFATPCAWGDLLGCAWTGTAHASTSTRAAARARLLLGYLLKRAQGAIRLVWKTELPSTHGTDLILLQSDASNFSLRYEESDDKYYFTVGGTDASTAAQSFAAGDVVVLHLTWLASTGLAIYINGASAGTASYAVPTFGSDLYVGTNTSAGGHSQGVFMGLDLWNVALSAAEIAADYADIAPLVQAGKRVSAIPWLWVKDGDNVVDNCNDADRDNFCVVAGVPGSGAAVTAIQWQTSAAMVSLRSLWISQFIADAFVDPGLIYSERSGTTNGTASGGAHETISIDTSGSSWQLNGLLPRVHLAVSQMECILVCRLRAEGSNLQIAFSFSFTATVPGTLNTEWKSITPTDEDFRYFSTLPLVLFSRARLTSFSNLSASGTLALRARRSSGSANNVDVDYFMLMPRPLMRINASANTGQGISYVSSPLLAVASGDFTSIPAAYSNGALQVVGDLLELAPGKHNHLIFLLGSETTSPLPSASIKFQDLSVTPRYALL